MSRWFWFCVCLAIGLVLLLCGLLMPMHLRSVEVSVLWKAGRDTTTLSDRGLGLLGETNLGGALLLSQTAQKDQLPGRAKLASAWIILAQEHPDAVALGRSDPQLESLATATRPTGVSISPSAGISHPTNGEPFTDLIVGRGNQDKVIEFLGASRRPAVQELIACRALTNTTVFSPSQSASGQALDGAIAVTGLLFERGYLAPGLSDKIFGLASEANRSGRSGPLEEVLLDLLSLGHRLDWGQLSQLASHLEDAETLRQFAGLVRQTPANLPVLFSAVELSGQGAPVVHYLTEFSQTGMKDLEAGLRFGEGGLSELLRRSQRLSNSRLADETAGIGVARAWVDFGADYALHRPWLSLGTKWLLYLGSGFWLALGLRQAKRAASVLERPLQVRGLHVARETLFALGFLVVVLLLSEPFLAQESQRMDMPFRVRLPTVGSAVSAVKTGPNPSIMNQLSLLTLLLFFVLQALIYLACLVKLAEIRRQRVPARVKLRLLENEDHLFDAGLYLGFVGTIISLILVSLGVIKPSLMAAYSSTSFGIIFVSIFKIFHLRPLRRILVLETEQNQAQPVAPLTQAALATTS
jgi:hypothetical protein